MASQTPTDGPLGNWYRNRIGEPSTRDEVRGYWLFALGLVLAFIGVFLFFSSESAGALRQWSIVLAATGLLFLIAGPVIRLPLHSAGTWLTVLGVAISVVAMGWFTQAYPANWSPQTGQFSVIGLYAVGLLVVAVSAVAVPTLLDRKGQDAKVSSLQQEVAAHEASAEGSEATEAALRRDVEQLRSDLADTKADEAELAALLDEIRASESQFELYEDHGGEWRWRLRHQDGHVIGASNQGYDRQNDAQESMQAVRRDAHGATVLVIESEAELPAVADTGSFVFAEKVESKATFELYEGKGEDHRWRLRHDNGNIIATAGQGYASPSGAKHSVERIRNYVGPADYLQPDPTAIEVYRDEADEWRWRLRHQNGNVLAGSGEGYATRSGVRAVIDSLREQTAAMDIEVYEDDSGGFRWRLAGDDDKILVDSGGYESRDGARDAVERVREFLPEADIIDIGESAFEVYEGEGGDHRWRLRHRNGNILATGAQGYADRTGVWDGIESVKQNAPNADLEEPET